MTSIALAALFASVSSSLHLPSGLLSALCYVESGHRQEMIRHDDGGEDSIGECQIQYPTARLMGFRGHASDLKDTRVNVYYAGTYLRWQAARYNGDLLKAISAYNLGTHRTNRHGQALNGDYVRKVLRAWADHR